MRQVTRPFPHGLGALPPEDVTMDIRSLPRPLEQADRVGPKASAPRRCVVMQTLAAPPRLETSWS